MPVDLTLPLPFGEPSMPTDVTEVRTVVTSPTGLPPSRLDNCSSCASDCEIAPRMRELYRRVDGRLLCKACYQREARR